jgi:hypothetical protein
MSPKNQVPGISTSCLKFEPESLLTFVTQRTFSIAALSNIRYRNTLHAGRPRYQQKQQRKPGVTKKSPLLTTRESVSGFRGKGGELSLALHRGCSGTFNAT